MANGTIYFGGQKTRGLDSYNYRVVSQTGVLLASESGISRHDVIKIARRFHGYRPMFDNVPRGMQDDIKHALRR